MGDNVSRWTFADGALFILLGGLVSERDKKATGGMLQTCRKTVTT